MNKLDFGKQGEDMAVNYLKTNGFKIIDRNFKVRGGEIDIIASIKDSLRFVEVKTRKDESWQQIEDTITDSKLEFINFAAEEWFYRKNHPESFWQIDFIGIILSEDLKASKIVHLEDIG